MVNVRQAQTEDLDALFEMMIEIAEYHDQRQHLKTDNAELLSAGFSHNPDFGAIMATYDDAPAGYITYTLNYSIWQGKRFMNIDDVFVKASFRGKKIGEAMMKHISELCLEMNIKRVKWEVDEDNQAAIRFYKRLGATVNIKGVCHWDLSSLR